MVAVCQRFNVAFRVCTQVRRALKVSQGMLHVGDTALPLHGRNVGIGLAIVCDL